MPSTMSTAVSFDSNKSFQRTIDIAEATSFALLCMVQATGPIHCDVAFLAIKSGSTLHRPATTDAAEFKEAIEHRTIVSNVEASLLLTVILHVVGVDLAKEINVFIGVKLSHLQVRGRLCAL
jgi:hypothetical protein